MNNQSLFLAALGYLCVLTTALAEPVPNLVSYQGRVAVGTTNFDGMGQFKFALITTRNSVQATATATLSPYGFGTVTSITVTNRGAGYSGYPVAVTITGGGGSGATAVAGLASPNDVGGITSVVVTNGGSGYTSPPTVVIAPSPPTYLVTLWSHNDLSYAGSEPLGLPVALQVTKGLYSVLLGDTSAAVPGMTQPIPASVWTNPDVRLRVWFNDGTNGFQLLTPDQRLAPYGYLPDGSVSSTAIASGAITSEKIASGAVGGTQLAAGLTLGGTTTGTFTGDGGGLTNIPAAAIVPAPPGMVLIPAGTFTMGNSVAADTDITDAAPVSTTVSAFYMDVNEVTLSQWQSVYFWALDHGYTFVHAGAGKAANHPVGTVDWYDVVKWCNARSEQAGMTPVYYTDAGFTTVYRTGEVPVFANWAVKGYRLPTEAEWEKAARGGQSGQRFQWGAKINQNLANYTGATASYSYDLGPNGYNAIGSVGGTNPATSPVGTFAVNGYGLSDMVGNVYEWCWDWYGTPYAGGNDPHGPATGYYRAARGGSWDSYAILCRSAQRGLGIPALTAIYVGFRAVLPPI